MMNQTIRTTEGAKRQVTHAVWHSSATILHCLYLCDRDTHRLPEFLQAHESLAEYTLRQVAVYGANATNVGDDLETWVVDAPDIYELLPVKTYAMFQRALEEPDWEYLLKSDMDIRVDHVQVLRAVIHGIKYAGKIIGKGYACNPHWHFDKCRYKVYKQECPERLYPSQQVGYASGPAYLLHRDAVSFIVERGLYFAMEHIFEDVMVGKAIEDVYPPQHYLLWQ